MDEAQKKTFQTLGELYVAAQVLRDQLAAANDANRRLQEQNRLLVEEIEKMKAPPAQEESV